MDRHNVPGLTSRDAAEAHLKDLEIQEDYGCMCITYWVDEERGNVFCLIESPSKQIVSEMHKRAHGLIPHDIIEVDSNLVKAFIGRIQDPDPSTMDGTGLPSIINDPAYRYLLVVDLKDRVLFECLYEKSVGGKLIMSFNSLVQQSVQHYIGRIVESQEEFLASFVSVTNAIDCAIHIRNSIQFQNTCYDLPKIEIKIGLSAGFPVSGNKILFGDAVKKAKRLSFISEANRIYLTSNIKEQYKGNAPQVYKNSRTIRTVNTDEELFLDQLMDTFQNSLFEPDIKMEKFCHQLGVSTSKLYRNTVLLTGLSPNDLLKEIRLVTALELMKKQNKNISETSYELGFANPSYFTKCFKKRYNVLPAEFIKNMHLIAV
ncbi:MAG TPA: nickel-binding protein [Bacteroidales bacterium]|nr:nickel-binding protein [Bacteroidales bacterium]